MSNTYEEWPCGCEYLNDGERGKLCIDHHIDAGATKLAMERYEKAARLDTTIDLLARERWAHLASVLGCVGVLSSWEEAIQQDSKVAYKWLQERNDARDEFSRTKAFARKQYVQAGKEIDAIRTEREKMKVELAKVKESHVRLEAMLQAERDAKRGMREALNRDLKAVRASEKAIGERLNEATGLLYQIKARHGTGGPMHVLSERLEADIDATLAPSASANPATARNENLAALGYEEQTERPMTVRDEMEAMGIAPPVEKQPQVSQNDTVSKQATQPDEPLPRFIVTAEQYDKILEIIKYPPEPTQALRDLLSKREGK